MLRKKVLTISMLFLVIFNCHGQRAELQIDSLIYKTIDTVSLGMKVVYPPVLDTSVSYPGMVFFFGGGWSHGTINHFAMQADYFAHRGIICFLVDYRVESRHGTTAFEALSDAKSAIRFVRQHADKFYLDTNKVIASGGSAGGHLAAATAFIQKYSDPSDNMNISPTPNALVLFNPVIDNGPGGYGYERIGDAYKDFSPLHNIQKNAPPTIVFLGTADALIPVETMEYYKVVMEKVGSRCDLVLYKDQKHGFFNFSASEEYYRKTVLAADEFLSSLGYIKGEPTRK